MTPPVLIRWLVLTASCCCYSLLFAREASTFPEFQGTVVPLQTPLLLQYDAHESEERIRTTGRILADGKLQHAFDDTIVAHRTVRRHGEHLLRTYRVSERKAGDMDYTLASRALSYEVKSDLFGNNNESAQLKGWDTYVQKASASDDVSETARSQLLSFYQNDEALLILPSTPQATGSTIDTIPFLEMLQGMEINPDGWPKESRESAITSVLKGYGFLDGRKVFVVNTWGDLSFEEPGGRRGLVVAGGYALLDAHTLATVLHEFAMQVDLTDPKQSPRRRQYQMSERMEAEVTRLAR